MFSVLFSTSKREETWDQPHGVRTKVISRTRRKLLDFSVIVGTGVDIYRGKHLSVLSPKDNAAQQILKARIRTKAVEAGIDLQDGCESDRSRWALSSAASA